MNDEFVKDAAGAESVEAYKKETRERLEKEAKSKGDAETENNIVKAITDKAEAEIPQVMIENQVDMMVRNAEYRLSQQYGGLKLEDYLKYMGTDMEAFRKGYEAQAADTVKSQLSSIRSSARRTSRRTTRKWTQNLKSNAKADGQNARRVQKGRGRFAEGIHCERHHQSINCSSF